MDEEKKMLDTRWSPHLEMNMREVPCQKAVSDDSFPGGAQRFNFSVGRPNGWVPHKSYVRVSMELTRGDGVRPKRKDALAFAESAAGNLYNNCKLLNGGQDISTISSHVPQATMIKHRLLRSGAWLDNEGKEAYGMETDLTKRILKVSEDGQEELEFDIVRPGVAATTINSAGFAAADLGSLNTSTEYETSTAVFVGDFANVVGSYLCIAQDNADETKTNYQRLLIERMESDSKIAVIMPTKPTTKPDGASGATAEWWLEVPRPSAQANTIQMIWQPPLGVFDSRDVLGTGAWQLELNPSPNYEVAGVQNYAGKVSGSTADTFRLKIKDVKFYVCMTKKAFPDNFDHSLKLYELQLYTKLLSAGAGGDNFNFTVPSSTRGITVFTQAAAAGTGTINPISRFTAEDFSEANLSSIQLTYGSVTKPATRWTSEQSPGIDYMYQRYKDTFLNAQSDDGPGSVESYKDWTNRGGMYHFDFSKDVKNNSTELDLQIQFANIAPNTRVYVCAHYGNRVVMRVKDGFIAEVNTVKE